MTGRGIKRTYQHSSTLRFAVRLIRMLAEVHDWEGVRIVIDECRLQELFLENEARCLDRWAERRGGKAA